MRVYNNNKILKTICYFELYHIRIIALLTMMYGGNEVAYEQCIVNANFYKITVNI